VAARERISQMEPSNKLGAAQATFHQARAARAARTAQATLLTMHMYWRIPTIIQPWIVAPRT